MVKEMRSLYDTLPTTCDANSCPQGDWAGCVVRTAGHDFMDRKEGTGGPDGCIALDDPDNRGLSECLYEGFHGISLAYVYANFCARVSLADFLVISAEAVMNFTRERVLEKDPSRAPIDFRSNFKYGRITSKDCAWAYGRMPSAEESCNEVDEVLGRRLGLSRELSAAILGVHTLGRAELNVSGYEGTWKEVGEINKFDNGYYHAMVVKGWAPKTNVGGNSDRNQWQRVDMGVDWNVYGKEIMLNTDICLLYSADDGNPMSDINAKSSRCCAWSVDHLALEAIEANGGIFCGLPHTFHTGLPKDQHSSPATSLHGTDSTATGLFSQNDKANFTKQRAMCCSIVPEQILKVPIDLTPDRDCGIPGMPAGRWKDFVLSFAANEDLWLEKFLEAWQIATASSQSSLSLLATSTELHAH
mmetsp:Transcript_80259/g.142191  ORF Transcript_80259/g.142191 Transcript_80259/m.142191 type:complete len:415 (+) Transcript_80259:2-1246(+)